MKQPQQQNNTSPFLLRFTYVVVAFALAMGMLIGYGAAAYKQTQDLKSKSQMHSIQLLIHTGDNTRTWSNVSLNEGESVGDIIDRISGIEHIQVSWSGSGKDRSLMSLFDKNSDNGAFSYYVNSSVPLATIGRFFPKNGDVISIIYTKKNL